MIDLHTHSIFSDGELIPAESAQRAYAAGYKAIAITDHADYSNIDFILPRIIKASARITRHGKIRVLPGLELTHIDPSDIEELAAQARNLGAKIVIVHGETLTEPVPAGTNLAAIRAGVDILAHPGLITEEVTREAAAKGVFLEITTRRGTVTRTGMLHRWPENATRSWCSTTTLTHRGILSALKWRQILLGEPGYPMKKLPSCSKILKS